MKSYNLTQHAKKRMNQRGLRVKDIDVIMRHGTQLADNRVSLNKRDVHNAIARMRRDMQILERLRGRTVIVDGRDVITCF